MSAEPRASVDRRTEASAARLRNRRNAVTIAAGIKLGIFTIISVLVTGLLAAIMGNVGFGAGTTYQAVFSTASMLEKGDDVRVAGVSVGEVKKVEHHRRTQAIVTIRVKSDVPLTTTSRAEVRFLNLVGDRYLALTEGTAPTSTTGTRTGTRLRPDAVIPVTRTSPALDLTVLFNGFKPLFEALDPDQVNDLSMNLVRVLQGEGGTVRQLLASTASLTSTLADRDQLIGEVIGNLGQTLQTVDEHHQQLDVLVRELKRWLGELARDRGTIGDSLDSISDLTVVVADLVRQGRPLLKSDIAELRTLAALLNEDQGKQQITELLDRLPELFTDQTRTGTYGSWYNYYICGFSGRITLPEVQDVPGLDVLIAGLNDLNFHSTAPRCNGAKEPR